MRKYDVRRGLRAAADALFTGQIQNLSRFMTLLHSIYSLR
jgi:hypothetical protein